MRGRCWGRVGVIVAVAVTVTVHLAAAGESRAQPAPAASPQAGLSTATQEEIDDPKVARRLKTRAAAPAPAASAPIAPIVAPVTAPVSAPAPASSAPSPPPSVARRIDTATMPDAKPAAPPSAAEAAGGQEVLTRKLTTVEDARSSGVNVPRLKIGWRRFSFVRLGATDGPQATSAASEPFNVLSLDYYPASSYVRFGVSAQYGAESGKLMGGGDYFFAQTFSLGGQFPGRVLTPFAEAFAGAGYMRRLQFASSVPTAYWQFGVDVGTEIFMAKYADISIALGYLHPVNGFTRGLSFTSVYVDTWSLKIAFGF